MTRLRLRIITITAAVCVLVMCLSACGAASVEARPVMRPDGQSMAPLGASAPMSQEAIKLPPETEGWQGSYLAFLEDNYDIFIALWPDGISGVGFIDLDLDGTPEMVVFDQGASATMGVHLFDLIDGQVYCVSSALDSAAGAFGDEYFTAGVSVCASFFEAFRLTRTEQGEWCFWVSSANGTLETSWDEIIRFDADEDGVLIPVSVCTRYLESDVDTGLVVDEDYTVGGETGQAADYQEAANVYRNGADAGYEACGVFLWSDMNTYDVSYEGFMAMARDAVDVYAPITEAVTFSTLTE